jgi:hypothetical protein
VSIDDRIRAATEATAATVREIRPLALPDDLRGTEGPVRARRRLSRGWGNWLIPLAAAAAVIAVAATLVAVRNLPGGTSVTSVRPPGASEPAFADGVPRYYVALVSGGGTPDGVQSAAPRAVVGDDRTGRTLAVVPALPGQSFTGVTAAADDRTFVLSSYGSAERETTWYLLRISPGAASPVRLTRLPIKPLAAQASGLALSPDGSELAVMFPGSSLQLRTYSVSSGALLGTWHTDTVYWMPRIPGANAFGLSWLADGRRISFRFDAYAENSTEHLVTVRVLDVTAAGHDLLADSRLAVQVPLSAPKAPYTQPCDTSLVTPDGRSVVCSTSGVPASVNQACVTTPPSLVSYSAATGKPLRVIYQGWCGLIVPLWTDPSARQVIGLLSIPQYDKGPNHYVFGVIAGGHLTSLPALLDGAAPQVAFLGTSDIAF